MVSVGTTADVLDGNTSSIANLIGSPGADGAISLREAISASNNTAGADTVNVPAGTYTLTRTGADDLTNLTGDLDVLDDVTIIGAGAANTIIDGNDIDRVIEGKDASLTIDGVTVQNGKTIATASIREGGGIRVRSDVGGKAVTIRNSTIRSNEATNNHVGGIYTLLIDTSIENTLITENTAIDTGGVAFFRGSNVIKDSTISNNTATRDAGGVTNFDSGGFLTIERSTIEGNTAARFRGGVFFRGPGALVNSTVSDNEAGSNIGGVEFGAFSTNYVVNSTIVDNRAVSSSVGGLSGGTGGHAVPLQMSNTIVAGNTAGGANPDVNGSFAATSVNNLIGDVGTVTTLTGPGNQLGTASSPIDPLLGPLQNNGGVTETHALLPGSPAIDAGSNSAAAGLTTDQRGTGFARIDNGTVNVGAVEFTLSDTTFVSLDAGNLKIEDVAGGNTDDMLSISVSGSNLIVNDPSNTIGADVTGATGGGTNTVTVPLSAFTAEVVVRTLAGDDTIDLDGLANLPGGIDVDAGTGADVVTVDGDINLVGADATISAFDVTIRDDLTTDGSGSIDIDARRKILVFQSAVVSVVDGDLTMNANDADDQTTSFEAILVDQTSILRTSGMGNISLVGTSGDDPASPGGLNGVRLRSSTVASTGTGADAGTITLTGVGGEGSGNNNGVVISSSSLTSIDGDIGINGTAGIAATASVARGFSIAGSTSRIESTGTGANAANITIHGTGGDTFGESSAGAYLAQGLISSLDGDIDIVGVGPSQGGFLSNGIVFAGNGMDIQVTNGDMTIDGTGTAPGGADIGVFFFKGGDLLSLGSGSIEVIGESTLGARGIAIGGHASADIHVGGPSVTGNITFTADRMSRQHNATHTIQSSGTVTFRPKNVGTAMNFPDATGGTLSVLTDGFDSIVLGAPNAGDIAIGSTTTGFAVTDPVTVVTGGNIHSTDGLATNIEAPSVALDGNVSPGQSPGILHITGNATLADGDTFTVEVGGTSPGETTTDHDQLAATGSVTIGANVTLDLQAFGGFTPSVGDSFTIVSRTGGSGQFDGLAEEATINNFLGSGLDATITYAGDDGDDVVVSLTQADYDFTLATFSDDEGNATNTTNVVMLTRSNGSAAEDVDVVLTSGGAIAGDDFTAGPVTVSFAVGETTKAVPIELLGDVTVEQDESLTLSLTGFTGSSQVGTANPTATLSIDNDDSATVSISDAMVVEGGNLEYAVTLSNPVDVDTEVTWSTNDGSATTADNDYTAQTGQTVTIPAGETTAVASGVLFSHQGNADPTTEGFASLNLQGGAPINDGGTLAWQMDDTSTSTGFHYVIDSSNGLTSQIVSDAQDNGWKLSWSNRVVRIPAADGLGVRHQFVDGDRLWRVYTSNNGTDHTFAYEGTSSVGGGRIPRPVPGSGLGYVDFDVVYDPISDSAEIFANGVSIAQNWVGKALSIPPQVGFGTNSQRTPETRLASFGFSINAGLTVATTDDNTVELDETLTVDLTAVDASGRNVTLGDASGEGTIENDDFAPVANAGGPHTIDEGDGLSLDASASTDADSASLTYRWGVDGDNDFDENVTGETPTLSATQMAALGLDDGPDSRTITVEASDGTNIDTAQTTLTIDNVAPDFEAGANETLLPLVAGVFSRGPISFTDPGADVWTGTVNYGDSATNFPLVINQTTKEFSLGHTYTTEGTFTVTVTVDDNDPLGTHADTFDVTVILNVPEYDDFFECLQDPP